MRWVLIGTKIDLRNEHLRNLEKGNKMMDRDAPTTEEEGDAVAKRLSSMYCKGRYLECSVYTGKGIEGVLEEVSDRFLILSG